MHNKYLDQLCELLALEFNCRAEECLHPFLKEFIKERAGHWLFEIPNLKPLEKELNKYGYTLTGTYHMFLSTKEVLPKRNIYP